MVGLFFPRSPSARPDFYYAASMTTDAEHGFAALVGISLHTR